MRVVSATGATYIRRVHRTIGMPILDVDKARTVVVVKCSLSPGCAGIPNPLFAANNSLMFFGSAKEAVLDLVAAVKES